MATRLRRAKVSRKTSETNITLELTLDGKGVSSVKTGIPFFDHMLSAMTKHGLMDLKLKAKGDIDVDFHHTVEDIGLCIGEAIKKALGTKAGIRRFGSSKVPMMDAMASVTLDIGGRPYFKYNKTKESASVNKRGRKGDFDMGLMREFMTSLANTAEMDLHVTLNYGEDLHHSVEAIYKALGRALRVAFEKDPRIKGVMSTKGKI
ncbi:MAG: imidazoleglycerol-phosphate dehydratase HisB [Deltaproteobacteria bacterium]|nr:imidazoleglycerol-phosphate dehydratase HisB [Deltaproteobacteria bacterium]